MARYGGIEAGGTKFVCGVGDDSGALLDEIRFPTTTPEETIGRAIAYFRKHRDEAPLRAIGIGAFGPIDLKPGSPTWGFVTTTPKSGWRQSDLAGPIREAFGVAVGFDTDVNAAALGEARWGAARGLENVLYLTVGTGIGGGAVVGGRPVHGLVHSEMGHIRVRRDPARDPFSGCCPWHGDCLEGLASGPAMAARWGRPAEDLPPDHEAWALEADYLAQALANYILTLSPERIVLGGGVMQQAELLGRVRTGVSRLLNGYVQAEAITERIESYIVAPGLGARSGVLGAVALGMAAAEE